jgi:hypothetical protein
MNDTSILKPPVDPQVRLSLARSWKPPGFQRVAALPAADAAAWVTHPRAKLFKHRSPSWDEFARNTWYEQDGREPGYRPPRGIRSDYSSWRSHENPADRYRAIAPAVKDKGSIGTGTPSPSFRRTPGRSRGVAISQEGRAGAESGRRAASACLAQTDRRRAAAEIADWPGAAPAPGKGFMGRTRGDSEPSDRVNLDRQDRPPGLSPLSRRADRMAEPILSAARIYPDCS